MKLSPRDAPAFLAKPDPKRAGILIYGADAMRVALKRQQLVAAIIGPKGDEEMRLSRMTGSELRKDPTMLMDAIKSVSFFPGQRAAFVEDATDSLSKTILAALDDWQEGDAQIVVTASSLTARSALRKAFEAHSNAFSLGVYDDPPSRAEIEAEMKKVGMPSPSSDGMSAIVALSKSHDPGEFRQILEKLALYKIGDGSDVSPADVANCAPASSEVGLDELLHVVAESRHGEIGPLVRRLDAQGTQPVGLCIALSRHFRALHNAASDPAGPSAGIAKLRPPVFGPRRDRMQRQAQKWGMQKLEAALHVLVETDLTLRSAQRAPHMALVERAMIRLAMMGR